jgi:hypothetical protein
MRVKSEMNNHIQFQALTVSLQEKSSLNYLVIENVLHRRYKWR